MNAANVQLFRTLADLYPGEDESAVLMAQAGISAGRIHNAQNARSRWFAIVSEAEKDGRTGDLLRAALDDYPNHQALKFLVAALPGSARQTVLAIWPHTPGQAKLDQSGEAAALYAVGLDYVAVQGAAATRDAVVREWQRVKPTIVEIGAHGVQGELYLTDGPTNAGWWTRLVRLHQPELIVLLACQLSAGSGFDIPDALMRAGVRDVIAVSDSILDTDAVLFARVFYENLMAPMPVASAVDIAKLVLTDAGANMVRHRERREVQT